MNEFGRGERVGRCFALAVPFDRLNNLLFEVESRERREEKRGKDTVLEKAAMDGMELQITEIPASTNLRVLEFGKETQRRWL